MNEQTLLGRVIALPENRELDVLAGMIERRGGTVVRCPLVAILDAPDPQPVLSWVRSFNAGACDDLILLTGEGLRRMLSCIERHEPTLREGFVRQLARVRKTTRGPKPARALRELGLKPDIEAETPTTEGVIATLSRLDLKGRHIGVQLYGTDPNLKLIEFLTSQGAQVHTVAPYVYADRAADDAVRALVERMRAGEIDAIAFTSKAQVDRLFNVIPSDELQSALKRTRVAAIGPVVRATLQKRGCDPDLMPNDSFFMKPLVRTLEQHLGARS
jgi:uroporphyrinogen-III synthase